MNRPSGSRSPSRSSLVPGRGSPTNSLANRVVLTKRRAHQTLRAAVGGIPHITRCWLDGERKAGFCWRVAAGSRVYKEGPPPGIQPPSFMSSRWATLAQPSMFLTDSGESRWVWWSTVYSILSVYSRTSSARIHHPSRDASMRSVAGSWMLKAKVSGTSASAGLPLRRCGCKRHWRTALITESRSNGSPETDSTSASMPFTPTMRVRLITPSICASRASLG